MTHNVKILGPDDVPPIDALRIVTVDVPEWGGAVCLGVPSSVRRDRLDTYCWRGEVKDMDNFRALQVALCLCDAQGKPWYDDPIEGAKTLGQRPGSSVPIKRLFKSAKRLCPDDEEEIAELEKNSDAGPDSSGSSASPAS